MHGPRFFPPHPALAGYILHIMVIEVYHHWPAGQLITPYPPMPQNVLNFYPGDPIETQKHGETGFIPLPESVLVGPQITRVNIAFGRRHRFVSVMFQPGALYRLLHIPLTELFDQPFDATLLFGRALREVNQRLKEVEGISDMKDIVEGFLLQQVKKAGAIQPADKALQLLMQNGGLFSIDWLAAEACLGLRQFERKCRELTGMSPKLFARVTRFSRAYRMKERAPGATWTAIAHECGYFDQMHFIKEFKFFTGVTPNSLAGELRLVPHRLQGNIPDQFS
jgi:AraC-like DNA-binding protein